MSMIQTETTDSTCKTFTFRFCSGDEDPLPDKMDRISVPLIGRGSILLYEERRWLSAPASSRRHFALVIGSEQGLRTGV